MVRATEGEHHPMERERKGRARPERGLRPLLTTLGLVTISKSGAMKIAWREIGPELQRLVQKGGLFA